MEKCENSSLNNIGKRIRDLRGSLTQTEFAEKMGVCRALVGKWENGTSPIGNDELIKLSDMYNVSCDYILRGIGSEYLDIYRETGLSPCTVEELKKGISLHQTIDKSGMQLTELGEAHQREKVYRLRNVFIEALLTDSADNIDFFTNLEMACSYSYKAKEQHKRADAFKIPDDKEIISLLNTMSALGLEFSTDKDLFETYSSRADWCMRLKISNFIESDAYEKALLSYLSPEVIKNAFDLLMKLGVRRFLSEQTMQKLIEDGIISSEEAERYENY